MNGSDRERLERLADWIRAVMGYYGPSPEATREQLRALVDRLDAEEVGAVHEMVRALVDVAPTQPPPLAGEENDGGVVL